MQQAIRRNAAAAIGASLAVQRDELSEHRKSLDVVAWGVERIDDPAPGGVPALDEFFADDRVVGAVAIEPLANRALDRFVDFRDRRLILFGPHRERAAKVM